VSRTRSHWEDVYGRKPSTGVSWYQPHLDRSLGWIAALAKPSDAVIDVGGGASTLVDDLLGRGFRDLTVLDVSGAALAVSRARLGAEAAKIRWVEADITTWQPDRPYDVWHDRAVFHFMTSPAQQEAYLAALRAGTRAGSLVVMATFAPDGPESCSGLPVQRYDAETLAARLGSDFVLVDRAREDHRTPWGSEQRFTFAALRRRDAVGRQDRIPAGG